MDFTFELGSATEPKGHALIYFRSSRDESEVLASYLVVPPVQLNLAKYMPPMFASSFPAAEVQNVSAIPLPPLPEAVESYAHLRRLATARGDDLIYCGTFDPADVQSGLLMVGEAARQYLQLYSDYARGWPPVATTEPPPELELSGVLYALMAEKQRLTELAKLTGKLRYAVEGQDAHLVRETVGEMETLGQYIPEKYRVSDLIAAAQVPGPRGQRLSQLYIDRSYRLSEEDYASLQALEDEIRSLQAE